MPADSAPSPPASESPPGLRRRDPGWQGVTVRGSHTGGQPVAGGQSSSALTPGPTERLGHRLSWFECVPPITRPTEDISRLRGEPAADPARRLAHHGGTASTRTRTGMTPLDTLPRACAAAYERSMIRPEMVGPRSFTRT